MTSWAAAGGAHASGWLRLFQVVPFPSCASAGGEDLPQDVSNWECRCEREQEVSVCRSKCRRGGKTGREREQVHMGVREHLKIRAFD